MVLVATGDQHMIANDLAVAFEDGNELPALLEENFLEDVDALSVAAGAGHMLLSLARRKVGQIRNWARGGDGYQGGYQEA